MLEAHQLAPQILTIVNTLLTKQGLLLKSGTAVDATLIAAPSSTKNSADKRDPDMHQTKKGGSWYFGMKTHIGVDADSGLVHTIVTTPANAHDITKTINLLNGQETDVFGDSGYRGIERREEAQGLDVAWRITMMPSKRKGLNAQTALG